MSFNAAFAAAEDKAWGTWSTRQADGTWVTCAEPDSTHPPARKLYEPQARARGDECEAVVSAEGRVQWVTQVGVQEDARRTAKLEKWLSLSAEDKAPFLERAKRHIPEEGCRAWAEYAAYYLFARGLHHPYSAPEYRVLRARIGTKTRKRMSRRKEGGRPLVRKG